METKFGWKLHNFNGPVVSNLKEVGKASTEWDLNDWKWDGDLFVAAPLNSVPTDCRSRQIFPVSANNGASNSFSSRPDEVMPQNERENRDLEKRRRVVEVENEKLNEEGGSLNLQLGRQVSLIEPNDFNGKSGKKTKIGGVQSSRAVLQVEDCKADLSTAKDYHRRHKVCDVHSKATSCLVGNVIQRFVSNVAGFMFYKNLMKGSGVVVGV